MKIMLQITNNFTLIKKKGGKKSIKETNKNQNYQIFYQLFRYYQDSI